MERRILVLRSLFDETEHLARCGEVKTRLGAALLDAFEQIEGSVDVRVQRGERVFERRTDEALRCEMIELIRLQLFYDGENARVTFESARMKLDVRQQLRQP